MGYEYNSDIYEVNLRTADIVILKWLANANIENMNIRLVTRQENLTDLLKGERWIELQ
jgi:hypothetical protein